MARGDLELVRSRKAGLRVLFIGNSFTYRNEMPALVHELASADEPPSPMFVVEYVAPNWSLEAASKDDGLERLLRDDEWDVAVLQERSFVPALPPDARSVQMDRFAHALKSRIDAAGAETILFMTWGYEDGDDAAHRGDTFREMQERLGYGYSEVGRKLNVRVVPVGRAWAEAIRRAPGFDLWADDGRHPSRRGSYLTACVFYAALADRSPVGNKFTGGLSFAEATFLQGVAWDVADEYT